MGGKVSFVARPFLEKPLKKKKNSTSLIEKEKKKTKYVIFFLVRIVLTIRLYIRLVCLFRILPFRIYAYSEG